MVFQVYNDPSHGWVRVKRNLLKDLNIQDQISSCSYQKGKKGNWVYLEEDQDAATLIKALNDKGMIFSFKNHYSKFSSKIRSYDSYKER